MPENTPETASNLVVVPQGGLGFEKFDHKKTAEFSERSLSEETRRAYRRVIIEFFNYFKNRHPSLITSKDILGWRDNLRQKKKKAATIAFKLSVIRSLYLNPRKNTPSIAEGLDGDEFRIVGASPTINSAYKAH